MSPAVLGESASFLGRQPIVDADLQLYGYELLFRSSQESVALVLDGDGSTAQVVLNALVEFGLDNVLGTKRGFINATRHFLLGSFAYELPRDRVVIEILEHVEADPETVAAVRALSNAGYLLALDDYRPGTSADEFFPYAQLMKLDLRDYTTEGLAAEAARLKGHGFQLLIERVETHAEFEFCRGLGFQLFQGYYVARPMIVSGRSQRSQRVPTLRLLAKLLDESSTLLELEDAIGADVVISHKLLRVVNSAAAGIHGRVDSLRHAVLLLGRDRIRTWVSLIALAGLSSGLHVALGILQRAKMCDALGLRLKHEQARVFFLVGLLSTVDRLLGIPMSEVLASLPLSDDVNSALLTRSGAPGQVLAAVEAYEEGHWERVHCNGLTENDFKQAWSDSLGWVRQVELDLALMG